MENYTDWIMEINKKMLREKELSKPELCDKVICRWQINYKGHIGTEVLTDHITGDDYSDIKIGYGSILFKGTKKQFDALLDELYSKDNYQYKIIGEHLIEEVDINHDSVWQEYQDYLSSKK